MSKPKQEAKAEQTEPLSSKIGGALVIGVAVILIAGFFILHHKSTTPAQTVFTSVNYSNSSGSKYTLDFYKPYKVSKINTGNSQLVSEVAKGDKLPLTLSISSGTTTDYTGVENCTKYPQAFTVQNDHLKQTLHVCDMLAGKQVQGRSASDTVYAAIFSAKGKTHLVTVSQDYSAVPTTNPSLTQQAIAKFGMKPYRSDIDHILASIQVQ